MESRLKLSPTISYQRYGELFIVLDSRTGLDFQLNSEGGKIIEKIDSGLTEGIDTDSDFVRSLISSGIISSSSGDTKTKKSENTTNRNSSVFDELNDLAARELVPVSAIMELTYRCPLNCKHCYIDKETVQRKNELKKNEYFRFIDAFRDMGGLYVILTGGDPFLHPDIEEIFKYLRKKRIAVSVMSSGYRTDKELLKRLVSYGLTGFQASIYGPDPDTHDNFTGIKGSFEETLKTLELLRNNGIEVQAAVSVNTLNISLFNEIRYLLKNKGFKAVYNFEMFPKRSGDTSPVSLNISDTELFDCLKKIDWRPELRLKDKGPEDHPCNATRSLFSIDPEGNIFPCLEIREKAGNIRNEKFSDIWKHSTVLNSIRNIKMKDLKDCSECMYKNYCNRCHGGALKKGLEITDHSEFDCTMAQFNKKLRTEDLN